MKWFAGLLISTCLVLGTIAGTTAYLPKVTTIDAADELLLAAPAGINPNDSGAPLLDPGDAPVVLNAEVLALLSDAGVDRVRVKSFAWRRWSHRYLFLLSGVGLVLGAFLVRRETRRRVSAAVGSAETASPEHLLRDALSRVRALRKAVTNSEDANRSRKQVVESLDALLRNELDAFVQARPMLIGRFGMAGYARLMDRFAAAERQLNRAWSAAADHVMEESLDCLAEGELRLEETLEQLKA